MLSRGLWHSGIGRHRSAGGGASITLLQHWSAKMTTQTNVVTSAAVDTTGANFIVIVGEGDTGTSDTVTDSKSNVWTRRSGGAGYGPVIYYCTPTGTKAGTGHTFTLTSGGSYTAAMCGGAFSGVNATPFKSEVNYGMTYSPMSAGYVSPSVGDLVVTGLAGSAGTTASTASVDSNFTISDYTDQTAGYAEGHVTMAYLIAAGVSAENPQAWNSATTYQQGAVCRYNGVNYIYSAYYYANTNNNPATSGWWTVNSGTVAPTWTAPTKSGAALVTACFAHA